MKITQLKSGEYEIVRHERYGNRPEPVINTLKQLSMRARMAMALIEKWGMVAVLPDGEDSSGRQKLRMMKPKEIVERALDVARLAINSFEKEGWIDDLPSVTDDDEIEKPTE